LLEESRLPGPRANLELANVVADEGTEAQFKHFLAFDERVAPRNSQLEFLAVCGQWAWDNFSRRVIPAPLKYSEHLLVIHAGACAKA